MPPELRYDLPQPGDGVSRSSSEHALASQGSKYLGPRPKRRSATRFQTTPPDVAHAPASRELGDTLGETALAHSCFTEEKHQTAFPRFESLHRSCELFELAFAPYGFIGRALHAAECGLGPL